MVTNRINPNARQQRGALRGLGFCLAGVGGVLAAIGLIDFFGAFSSGPNPRDGIGNFWCAMVGLPMLGIGLSLLKAGYMGPIQRYVAGETAPVARDAVNYMVDGTEESIRKVGAAFRDEQGKAKAPASVQQRLEKLEGLRRDGLIDDSDYEQQKDRILSDL